MPVLSTHYSAAFELLANEGGTFINENNQQNSTLLCFYHYDGYKIIITAKQLNPENSEYLY